MILAFLVFPVGINEEDAFPLVGPRLVDDQDTGRDARAVEQAGGQSNHRFQHTIFDESLAAYFLFTATEQDPVRHDHGHLSIAL